MIEVLPEVKAFDLAENALLGRLYIGMPGQSHQSRILTNEAAFRHKAEINAVQGRVFRFSKGAISKLTAPASAARQTFYANTLPWDDNAYRLIPLPIYPELKKKLADIKNDFDDAVEEVLESYEELLIGYERRVGRILARENRFPSEQSLRSAFKFELIETQIANPGDLRLRHVDPRTVNDIRNRVSEQIESRLEEAELEIVARLQEVVSHLKDRATGKAEGKRIHTSIITNIEKTVEMLPKLNVSNNPEINRLIGVVRKEFTTIDVEDLRKNDKFRRATARAAGSVLADLKNYGVNSGS